MPRLRTDPLATTDVARDHPEALIELHELLLTHLQEHGAAEEMRCLWHQDTLGAGGDWAIDYPKADV
jgi:hypothetical protein